MKTKLLRKFRSEFDFKWFPLLGQWRATENEAPYGWAMFMLTCTYKMLFWLLMRTYGHKKPLNWRVENIGLIEREFKKQYKSN